MKQAIALLISTLVLAPVLAQTQGAFTPQIATATKQQADRLEILVQERNDIASRLQLETARKASPLSNSEQEVSLIKVNSLQNDLQAIDREINNAKKEASITTIWSPTTIQKNPKNIPQIDNSQTAQDTEKKSFESWDVFKNFGQKGN